MKQVEGGFEGLLWGSRYLVLVGVVASLAAAVAMLFMAAVDTVRLAGHALHYAARDVTVEAQAAMRSTAITHVVEIVDGFLLAAFLIIFALGLYELFVSKIEAAEGSAFADSILNVGSLDDLKGKLAQVILIMLVVKVWELVAAVRSSSALDVLAVAGGVALVGLAIFLGGAGKKKAPEPH
ncbi:MAG: YqhA family protein [Anaeromyxobacteraceae bacterium]|nr:YqhA family protein [Anaeromyxobacteraceae bacterium]